MSMTYAPVCVTSGTLKLTLVNECVAVCQGVAVIKTGPCTDAASGGAISAAAGASGVAVDTPFLSPEDVDTAAQVGMPELKKYRSEGFTFVGRVRLARGKARQPTVGGSSNGPVAAAGAG